MQEIQGTRYFVTEKMKKIIAIVSLITFLGSSMGIHIMHHDMNCCGLDSEIINVSDLVHHRNLQCCTSEPVTTCAHCTHEMTDCAIGHGDHHDHHDCCSHEVVCLHDNYYSQAVQTIKFNPGVQDISSPFLALNRSVDTDEGMVIIAIRPPPKLLIEQSAAIVTCAFRC